MKISASVLSADFANLGIAVSRLEEWGADYVHIDVMDGNFVPQITFGSAMTKALRRYSKLPFDVHLMVENPERQIPFFKAAGADIFTFHAEADRHIHRTLELIKRANMRAGIAINPGTPISAIEYVLDMCDLVLIMSVDPGASGQRFIPSALGKVKELNDLVSSRKLELEISVDGGVDLITGAHLHMAGSDVLVSGSSLFSSEDKRAFVAGLKKPSL
ncbi:MAG: ribulose-phosphate 3-epimerase [Clostridia bacterium]